MISISYCVDTTCILKIIIAITRSFDALPHNDTKLYNINVKIMIKFDSLSIMNE